MLVFYDFLSVIEGFIKMQDNYITFFSLNNDETRFLYGPGGDLNPWPLICEVIRGVSKDSVEEFLEIRSLSGI